MKIFQIVLLTIIPLFCIQQSVLAQTSSTNELIINRVPITHALESVLKLQPMLFEFNPQKYPQLAFPTGTRYGFNTVTVKQLFPQAVSIENKSYATGKNQLGSIPVDAIDMEKLIPFLVSAIQEQQQQIQALKKAIGSSKSTRSK